MIRLNNDYSEGCHPSILLRLNEMNLEQNPGYGTDTTAPKPLTPCARRLPARMRTCISSSAARRRT